MSGQDATETMMRGFELKNWRQRNGYTQEALRQELNVSRQTLVGWEQSEEISRIAELALQALERLPDTRQIAGQRCKVWTRNKLSARELQALLSTEFAENDTDPLTGLHNFAGFLRAAEARKANLQDERLPASIICIDLDEFKLINDKFGHPAGDQVIARVATDLKQFGTSATLRARTGGDEFALFLPGENLRAALSLADRLRAKIAQIPTLIDSQPVYSTVSIGVAESTLHDDDFLTLFQQADKALYMAKMQGRNCVSIGSPERSQGHRING